MTEKLKIPGAVLIFGVVIYYTPNLIRLRIIMDAWVLDMIRNFFGM